MIDMKYSVKIFLPTYETIQCETPTFEDAFQIVCLACYRHHNFTFQVTVIFNELPFETDNVIMKGEFNK